MRGLVFFALGAGLVLGGVACSDSDTQTGEPATPTQTSPSTAQRADTRASKRPSVRRCVSRADRVCRRLNKRLYALGPGLLDAGKVPQAQLPKAAQYIDKRLIIARRMQMGIAAVGPPKDQRPAYDALLTAFAKYSGDLRRARTAARAGDLRKFRSAFQLIAPRGLPTGPDARRLSRAMWRFPFAACGKPPII